MCDQNLHIFRRVLQAINATKGNAWENTNDDTALISTF